MTATGFPIFGTTASKLVIPSNPSQVDGDGDGKGDPCDDDCPQLDHLGPVNFLDYCRLALKWQQAGPDLAEDLNWDGTVNAHDLAVIADHWLLKWEPDGEIHPKVTVFNRVDFGDFARLLAGWQQQGPDLHGDLSQDHEIDYTDLSILMAYWLTPCQPSR